MTFNTGNAVPSANPRDLYDNAENMDQLMNGPLPFYADRTGKLRDSWAGMENGFVSAQESRESRFDAHLAATGYQFVGDYAAGITLAERTQLVRSDGEYWRLSAQVDLPYVTTGAGMPESGSFVAVGDAALRQELGGPDGASMIGSHSGTLSEVLSEFATKQERFPVVATVGDGVADDWSVLQAALDTGKPHIFGGHCRVSKELVAPSSGAFLIGLPGAVIDGSEAGFTGDSVISVAGGLVQIAGVSGALVRGASTITFSAAHGLASGDVFCLWNPTASSWSAFRSNYHAGEWCKVEAVISSTQVLLTNELYDAYGTGSVYVYKLNAAPVDLRGFKVLAKDSYSGVDVTHATGRIDLDIEHAGGAAIAVNRCYDITIDGKTFNVGSDGDDYGVALANCQRVRIYGRHHSRRHSVMHGGGVGPGSVPCRDCQTIGATLTNDITSGAHNADFHGCSEDCWFIDCNISGGGTFQGRNVGYRGGRITAMESGPVIYAAEVIGGLFELSNVTLVTNKDPSSSSRGIIDFGGNTDVITANTVSPITIRVKDCRIVGRNLSNITSAVLASNIGSSQKINIDIDGLDLDVNNLGQILFTRLIGGVAASDGISITRLSGNAPSGVQLHNASGNAYLNFPHRLPKLTGSGTVTTSTSNNVAIGAPVTLRYAYPRKPSVVVGISERDVIGSIVPIGIANPVTVSSLRPGAYSPNASNFSSAVSLTLNWSAEISEF